MPCLALVVMEGGHAFHTVLPTELLCKVREYLLCLGIHHLRFLLSRYALFCNCLRLRLSLRQR